MFTHIKELQANDNTIKEIVADHAYDDLGELPIKARRILEQVLLGKK